jgi:hypothetical protein
MCNRDINPNCAEIFSYIYDPLPPAIGVIEGQAKKQMIKIFFIRKVIGVQNNFVYKVIHVSNKSKFIILIEIKFCIPESKHFTPAF